ncbi:YchJ family protein [Lysobacter terrae]
MNPNTSACPCGSGRAYSLCCEPFHREAASAPTAEALMRSRYCAYVHGDADYLRATWHASTRPATLDFSDAASTRWLGLEVKRHVLQDADHASVEFVARYRIGGGSAVRLHEISRFVREDGRWYYLDGEFPAR